MARQNRNNSISQDFADVSDLTAGLQRFADYFLKKA